MLQTFIKLYSVLALCCCALLPSCTFSKKISETSAPGNGQIVIGANAPETERYAARELRRYLYQLSGEHLPIRPDTAGAKGPSFVVGTPATNPRIAGLIQDGRLVLTPDDPGPQGYVLKHLVHGGEASLVIAGTESIGCLYGVYGLLDDHYNIGFYPAGDILPETRNPLTLPRVDERKTPAMAIRGFLPWTNFPQSATVFSWEDWKFVLDQCAKMRMNFIHIHNYNKTQGHYPHRYTEHNEMFHSFSYKGVRQRPWMPSAATGHPWCMPGWDVKQYRFGAVDLFDDYDFGADCTLHNESYSNDETFLKGSSEFQKVIQYAHARGIKIGLGLDIDLVPRDLGAQPDDPEIIESRVAQIVNDYPDLDYLLCFQSEKHSAWTSDEYKKWRFIFTRLYEEIGKRSPHTRLAVSGWGLNPKSIESLPEDVICAPIARYGASFENGAIYGDREYWGCPWMETDGNCSQHYYPYACHLSTTMASYQKRAPNMKGLYCLTWRISDAIEPKLSYIAKAPWDAENKYRTSRDVYLEYAQRCYGARAAPALTDIINENEAFAEDHGECRQIPVFTGSDRKALQRPIIDIGTLSFYSGSESRAVLTVPASRKNPKYGATLGVKMPKNGEPYATGISTGNWIQYDVAFPQAVSTLVIRAKAARDCEIELRHNSFNGPLLGKGTAPASKDWGTVTLPIQKRQGKQRLILRLLGCEMNDREKVKEQLAIIDRQRALIKHPGARFRLQLLRDRLAGVQAYLDMDRHFPAISWEALPGAFEPWVQSFRDRVYDISSLGNIMSIQHRFVKERYVVKEEKMRAAQTVKAPGDVQARGTKTGAVIRWQNRQPEARGYHVYRDGRRLNAELIAHPAMKYTDQASGNFRYQVSAVDRQGREGPRSVPSRCPAGHADRKAPRIVVISPPTSLMPGQGLEVKARVLDDRSYGCISAQLCYRRPGRNRWQVIPMERRTKAIFGARIPGAEMTEAGLEYHVQATDGDNTGVYPATAPQLNLTAVAWHWPDRASPPPLKAVTLSEQTLTWHKPAPDVFWIRIYRSRRPDFEPGPANALTYVPAGITRFKDNGLDWDGQPLTGTWYYRLATQDKSDNESKATRAVGIQW